MTTIPWARWVVRPTAWEEMEKALSSIVDSLFKGIDDIEEAVENPDHITRAVLGRFADTVTTIERKVTTRFGIRSLTIIEPFMKPEGCEPAEAPWTAVCRRRTEDGRIIPIVVKLVLGVNTLNSTARRALADTARTKYKPYNKIILTLVGSFKGTHVKIIEDDIPWLDAYMSWRWLTGSRDAYQRFLRTLYAHAAPLRRKILEMILKMMKT